MIEGYAAIMNGLAAGWQCALEFREMASLWLVVQARRYCDPGGARGEWRMDTNSIFFMRVGKATSCRKCWSLTDVVRVSR